MRKYSLINTNSYLRDSKRREALLAKTVVSSTAIEGVHLDWEDLGKSLFISNKDIRYCVSAKSSGSRRWKHPPSVCILDPDLLVLLHSTPSFCTPSGHRNPRVVTPLAMPLMLPKSGPPSHFHHEKGGSISVRCEPRPGLWLSFQSYRTCMVWTHEEAHFQVLPSAVLPGLWRRM